MQRTLVALGCALTLAGGSAIAQQQQQQNSGASSSGSNNSSGGSLTDKAKQAAQTIGEKTKEAAEKAKDKVTQGGQSGQSGQSGQPGKQAQAMGASGSGGSSANSANDPKQMQKQADADFKSAKAQCEPIQQKSQKTLCEKQAIAAHANAEVDIEKAKVAAQGGNTSSMGAGKASQ